MMAAYAQSMTAIDPDSGQLVEVPIDPNGTYVVQDSGAILTGSQMQLGGVVQAGKSLLKPELAQHLIQPTGFKTSLARGGFTQSIVDPRMSQSAQRGSRVLPGKPLSTGVQLVSMSQGSAGLIQQSAALAPTASGLLSLGTRYTPSSGSTLGAGTTGGLMGGGGVSLVNSTGISQGGGLFTQGGGMLTERDAGYRLAAAMTGASSRGRPRGRRPLRGQFPVVPIDMVRQLGIEQQVILQPAAPVAMRNKAILCRPLSVSRKTQSDVHAREAECQTEDSFLEHTAPKIALSSHDLEEDARAVVEFDAKQLEEAKKEVVETMDTDSNLSTSTNKESDDDELGLSEMPKGNTTQTEAVETSVSSTQTDEAIKKEEPARRMEFLPIPFPVPIYIPVPVNTYARFVPFAIPFPVPCVIPLPLVLKGDEFDEKPASKEAESTLQSSLSYTPADHRQSGQKRPPPRDSLQMPSTLAQTSGATSYASQSSRQQVAAHTSPTHAPASKRQRTQHDERHEHRIMPSTISDTNYHLKFSYGINAWRHWVSHSPPSARSQNLRTELLDVADADLNIALSRFVHEVRKPNNETYVADSIFYLCLGIQEYLNENGRSINLFGDPNFASFANALDTVLADFQPRISSEGLLICRIEEEHLWEARQLGPESPHILLFTLLYFITKHFCLRTGDAHGQLCFSNFHVKKSPESAGGSAGTIVFVPPESVSATASASSEVDACGGFHLYANTKQPERCPVRLYEIYTDKCPSSVVSQEGASFYHTPDPSWVNTQTWYSSTSVSVTDLQVMLNRIKMVKEIQEAFMNSQGD